MKHFLYLCVGVAVVTLLVTFHVVLTQDTETVVAAGSQPLQAGRDHKDHNREQDFYRQRASQNGRPLDRDAYDRALRQMSRIPRSIPSGVRTRPSAASKLSPESVTSLTGVVWTRIGPSPINQGNSRANGRVSSIAINPNNPNVVYQGSSGGGVWRSNDGGLTWTPLTDQQASLGTGEPSAIAVDPSDTSTIYVGTSARFVLNISKGILKSTDGGGSWIILGSGFPADNTGNADNLFAGQNVNVIIVDPSNSNILYLGASNGLFRSTDGGRNWTPGTNGFGDARSLVLDPTSPAANRILYAGVSGSGVRQSTNGGQTWTQILNTATPAVAAALPAGGGIGQVLVDLAPPTSPANTNGIQVLYASMQGTGGAPDPLGLFRSTDQGGTWNLQTSAGIATNTQGGYSFSMSVDPGSPGDGSNDIIYLGAVGATKSTDSGNNFAGVGPGIHVDSHSTWVFFPQPSPTPSIVYTGNDGGIWKSTDGGATWSGTGGPAPTINAGGLQTSLIYNIDVKNDATASATLISLQDNGTPQTSGSLAWTDSQGGDGWDNAFDAVTTNNAYNTSGFWPAPCTRVFISTNSGANFPPTVPSGNDITPWGLATDQGCYGAPVNTDPSQATVLYASGSQNLWQTQNGGGAWRIIANIGGAAQLKVAPANSNNVVAASGTQVFVSTNALAATVGPPTGVTFANITRNLPNRNIARVAFDPNDPTVIYATMSGFGGAVQPRNVFRTTIGGTAWTDISPPVDLPVNAIALDGGPVPTAIYIGNDLGVLRSVDEGANWTVLDDVHMPNVPVTDLAINAPAGVLRAGTFGRGAFEFAQPSGPVIAINAENGLDFGTVCQGETARLTIQVFNVGTQDLNINTVRRLFGSAGFTVLPNPAAPLIISPNSEVDFTVQFTPTVTSGAESAQIRISSDDPAAPAFDLMATAVVGSPGISTVIVDNGSYGDVCRDSFKDLDLTINNNGSCDLRVSSIVSSSAEFQTAAVLSYPLVIAPGGSLAVPIRFAPGSLGAKSANITIGSNDPVSPAKVVHVTGNVPAPDVRLTGSTDFGSVCAGVLAEKTVSVCNVGPCDLHVTSVAFEPPCADFTLVNNPFPATVSPDSCQDVVIRFTPTSDGPKSCTLVIRTDDPDTPVISKTVTASTPVPSIDVPPDLGFPPTVIQSVGACTTSNPFPVSNTGTCPLHITNFAVTADAAEYSLAALPWFPIILEPGHVAGEGGLSVVFAPLALDRDPLGALTVTYESDPVTHATTSVARAVCGEGVRTGARVLVTAGGVPLGFVEQIKLNRINANRNKNILDTVDNARNLTLQTVTPAAPCTGFQYHREYGTVSNPIQLLPGSYDVTVTAVVNNRRMKKTVGFDVTTCGFNPTIIVDF